MTRWIRCVHGGAPRFGALDGDDTVALFDGDMYGDPWPSGECIALDGLTVLTPCQPSKVIATYNNFGALLAKLKQGAPAEPQYLMKPPNTCLRHDGVIAEPRGAGRVIFEGELAVVIGRTCKSVPVDEAMSFVFGYTCANDVTAADVLTRDPAFPHWARAKGFDGFCPFGPCIATAVDWQTASVRTRVDGALKQDFPLSDMLIPVPRLVSSLSHDMTLNPGDLILTGTSVGVGVMKPGCMVEVEIDGIGCLRNHFQ